MPFTCKTKQITQAFLPWQFAAIQGCLNFFVTYGMFSMQGKGKDWPKALILPSAFFLALSNAAMLRYLPIKLPNYAHRLAQRPGMVDRLRRGEQIFILDKDLPRNLSEEQMQAEADRACDYYTTGELMHAVLLRSLLLPSLSYLPFLMIAAPQLGLSLDELPLTALMIGASVPSFLQLTVQMMAVLVLGRHHTVFRFPDRELEREDCTHTHPFTLGF